MEPSSEAVSAVPGLTLKLVLALICALAPLAAHAGAALTSMPSSSAWIQWNGVDSHGFGTDCFLPAGNQITSLGLVQTAAAQSVDCAGTPTSYTTAAMSLQSYSFTYGVIEFQAKFAGGQGTWPAVWLLGAECQPFYGGNVPPCNWPLAGSNEIDITEVKLGLPYQNIFSQTGGVTISSQPAISDVTQNYHDYKLVWSPTSVTWFVDDVETLGVSDPSYVPTTPMFVVIDLYMGEANGGGTIVPSTLPQSTNIRYLRVCPLGTDTCDAAHATIFDDEFQSGTIPSYPRHSSDLVWYRSADGALVVWPAGNSSQGRYLTSIPGSSGWQIAALGDFNGDGQTDLLWYRGSDGALCVWPSGDSSKGYYLTSQPASTGWQLAGVGDFDGDGWDDLLWYNPTDGSLEAWLSHGLTKVLTFASEPASSGWTIAGVGDFDGDGRADILWYRGSDGGLVVWPAGDSSKGYYLTSEPASTGWTIAGIGDFNGDGQADILWYRGWDGSLVVWPSGDSSKGYYLTSEPASTAWTIAAVGDFNGDGQADILWYRGWDGSTVVWPSGDSSKGYYLTSEPASSGWQIMGAR